MIVKTNTNKVEVFAVENISPFFSSAENNVAFMMA